VQVPRSPAWTCIGVFSGLVVLYLGGGTVALFSARRLCGYRSSDVLPNQQ
jgi:hypothetical protein